MLAREDFGLHGDLVSDAGPVMALTEPLLQLDGLRFMRDPTRGGIACIAHEINRATGLGVRFEASIPVKEEVQSVCDMLGYDPFLPGVRRPRGCRRGGASGGACAGALARAARGRGRGANRPHYGAS